VFLFFFSSLCIHSQVAALKKVKLLETLTQMQYEDLADAVHPQVREEAREG